MKIMDIWNKATNKRPASQKAGRAGKEGGRKRGTHRARGPKNPDEDRQRKRGLQMDPLGKSRFGGNTDTGGY